MRWLLAPLAAILLLAATVLAIAGCGSSDPPASEAQATTSATTATESTNAPATTQAPSHPSVTGFGATDSAWNEAHTEDTNYAHEAAYDPNSALPENDGRPGDEYTDVQHSNGHVTGYEYHFQSESAEDARMAILHEQFPTDAKALQYKELPTCALMLVSSPTLARPLGLPAGTPVAQVELETGSEASGHEEAFDPSSVDGALVSLGYPGIERGAPEC
jgi:arylsulfatase A-like enzyme